MNRNIKYRYFFVFLIVIINWSCSAKPIMNILPIEGIYDGKIGNKKLILVLTEINKEKVSGYYIHNGKKAVENSHPITLAYDEKQLTIDSEEFKGTFNALIKDNSFLGKLKVNEHKFFFWKRKLKVQFTRRIITELPQLQRYQEELFKDISVEKNLVYGNAKGYWTETPYLDDPYIEILAKGTVNLFKGEKDLDLKLDVYYPTKDSNYTRPLILLVHGGAFYVGNKQSETEEILANKFTKLGYVVASIDYRMGFRFKNEDVERTGYKAIQDVHAALRYLSNQAEKYGIDPEQIYVAGTSAGAMASLNITFLDNNERPESTFQHKKLEDLGNIENSGNTLKSKFKIKAVVNMWGAVSDTSIINKDEQIPVLSFHGNKDDIVPIDHDYPFKNTLMINRLVLDKIYGSEPIHQRLNSLGIENKLFVLDGFGHEPQMDEFSKLNDIMDKIQYEMIDFFYDQTASKIEFESENFIIHPNDKLKALKLKVKHGAIQFIDVEGGLKISDKADESTVIWLKNQPKYQLMIYTNNRFNAWKKESIAVSIEQN